MRVSSTHYTILSLISHSHVRAGTSHGSNRSSRANSRPTTSSGGRKNFTSTRSDGINDGALSSDSSDSNAAVYAEILGERRGTGVNRPGSGKTKRLGNIRHIGSSGSGGSGRLYKGTTRPLSAVSRLEQKLNNAMTELEQASAKVSQQKLEISHLQEGVSVALKMANSSSIRQTSIAPTRMSSSASTPALFTQKRTNAGMPYARKRRQIPRPTSSSSTASHKNRLKPLK